MKTALTRRDALKQATASAMLAGIVGTSFVPDVSGATARKGAVNHSVCRWCYNGVKLDDLCAAAKEMGIQSVELQGPAEWPTLQKYGLTAGHIAAAARRVLQRKH